jgi:hypothetical protein
MIDSKKNVAFFAYDWDSSRASEQDISDWFKVTERRTEEFVNKIVPKYDRTVLYLRTGSKSKQVWDPILKEYPVQDVIIDGYFKDVVSLHHDLETRITLNGRLQDADMPILNPERISYLTQILMTLCRPYWE